MLPALASTADAVAFGLDVDDAALLRASTRVRSFTGQQVSAGSSTVTLRGPISRLPQRPVVDVASVQDEDGNDVDFTLGAGGIIEAASSSGILEVAYTHGYDDDEIPDEIVEIVCTIAARLGNVDPALAGGVQQEQSGSASQTFGMDSFRGLSSLTSEEKAVLARIFPRLPKLIVMRP